MSSGPWLPYNKFLLKWAQGDINLGSDAFKMALFGVISNCYDTTNEKLTDLTSEVSGNGYARQDCVISLTNPTDSTLKIVADASVFTASGGEIIAYYAVIYDDTMSSPDLVAYCLLDETPMEVTVTDGNTLTIDSSSAGVFIIEEQV